MEMIKQIINYFTSPATSKYLEDSVDHADLDHKIKEMRRIQNHRVNIALTKGYL